MTTNKDYRIDLEFVQHVDDLPKMQAKINQWITKGELIKYEVLAMPYGVSSPGILFNICRLKGNAPSSASTIDKM